jgi:hypothetical protein
MSAGHLLPISIASRDPPSAGQIREDVGDHRVRLPTMRIGETHAVADEAGQIAVHSIRAAPVELPFRDTGGHGDPRGAQGNHLHVLTSTGDLAARAASAHSRTDVAPAHYNVITLTITIHTFF